LIYFHSIKFTNPDLCFGILSIWFVGGANQVRRGRMSCPCLTTNWQFPPMSCLKIPPGTSLFQSPVPGFMGISIKVRFVYILCMGAAPICCSIPRASKFTRLSLVFPSTIRKIPRSVSWIDFPVGAIPIISSVSFYANRETHGHPDDRILFLQNRIGLW
jgi:hypothetical protein